MYKEIILDMLREDYKNKVINEDTFIYLFENTERLSDFSSYVFIQEQSKLVSLYKDSKFIKHGGGLSKAGEIIRVGKVQGKIGNIDSSTSKFSSVASELLKRRRDKLLVMQKALKKRIDKSPKGDSFSLFKKLRQVEKELNKTSGLKYSADLPEKVYRRTDPQFKVPKK